MKKSTKLLSVILAIVMIFSSLSVMSSAYQAYNDSQEAVYDTNDKGLAFLLTDEQRASWLCDLLNGLLRSANIRQEVPIIGTVDLTSLDAVFATINNLSGWLGAANTFNIDLGLLNKLNIDVIKANKGISVNSANGATQMITALLDFLNQNIDAIVEEVIPGGISLGVINLGDLSAINNILADLDGFLEKTVYGLGMRKITNGIGNDPEWPNSEEWTADKMPLDTIVQNILVKVLTEPNHTRKATVPADNEIITNPTAFGATAAMIHTEAATDGSGDTWYYIYGTQNNKGEWEFTEASTKLDGVSDKNYILTWDENSGLVKDFDTSVFNFTSKPLYQMLGEVLPWAYETFGATNLDGQLRATLMQFAGAFNDASKVDDATKATLKAKMEAKMQIQDNGTKAALGDAYDAEVGAAGNYNFAYFSLSGADINTMPDDLYYVVEWGGNWEFYKVDFAGVTGEKLAMFNTINWEYQAPGTYAELMPAGFNSGTASSLRNITDAIGKILATAIKDLDWTYDSASEDNAHFEANLMKLVRKYLKLAPELIFGVDDAYKAEKIDTLTDEEVVVLIGADVMTWLMPALVLPEDVSCLEELLVYGVREFITEIMPQYSWDAKIEAAKTDADFLNIALDMGTSIGVYYLKNVMALGTTTNGSGTTTAEKIDKYLEPSADCATGWNTKLSYVVDQILTLWVPDLTADIKADNATAFSGNDGLMKLTAVLNSLFPGLLSLISGCSGNGYDCDLAVVKDLIAGILDLKIEPVAAKLYRNDTGYANKALYNAVVNIVLDLLNGLGASNSNDYSRLVSTVNTALEATNPLDTLVQDANIKPFIKNLLWVLVDGDTSGVPITVRNIWVQDVLAILMQVTGQMDDMSLSGLTQTLDKPKYIGSTSPVITPSVTLDTDGLKSVWYDGGYKTGTFHQDGAYSGLLTKYEICDLQGNVVATKDNINATLNPNQTYSGTSITGVAGNETKAYTLKSYVIVTLPDGTTKANNGEPIVTVSSFLTSAAANDDSVNPITVLDNKTDTTVKMWNIYLDEFTPLAQIGNFKLTVTASAKHDHKMWINGYGYLTDNGDGSYKFEKDNANAFTWSYRTSDGENTTLQAGDSRTVFYWAWNNDNSGTVFSNGNTPMESRQWYVDTKNFTRDQYPADFTSFAFNTTNIQVYWEKNIFSKGTDTHQFAATPYIIFYNSYGLEQQIASALNANRVADNYTTESWNAYLTALEGAIAEFYMAKTAATFMEDHMTNGVSNFKTASDNLKAAIEGLEAKVASAGDSAANDYTAEEKEVLANLKATLDTESAKGLHNQDYIMYRWLKYHNEYSYLWNIYNGSLIPSGVASDKLAGVPSDNATIDAVVAAADANKQAAITAMRVAPTAEEQAAAQQAQADFTANLPKIDTTSIQVDAAQMAQYEDRLIAKSSYTQYLNAALTLVAGAKQADYTAQSWAKFADAKAAAQAITASNKPSEIHKARYNLLVAYKGLLPAGTDVDLTALQEKMNFVESIFANPTLFKPSAAAVEAGYDTLDKAMAEVLKEAGAKVAVGEDTYYVGGNDTGAAWLDEAGMRTAKEAQGTVDRVTNEITNALAYVESAIKIVPDDTVADNTTAVAQNMVIDGIKPGTINSADELLGLVTTTVPSGYTANLAVTASAAVGFGTGTKVVLTVAEVPGLAFTHTVMVYGDVNGDGAIDAFDAALIDLHIAGTQLTGDFAAAADASADAQITVADYAAVESCAVGATAINQTRA